MLGRFVGTRSLSLSCLEQRATESSSIWEGVETTLFLPVFLLSRRGEATAAKSTPALEAYPGALAGHQSWNRRSGQAWGMRRAFSTCSSAQQEVKQNEIHHHDDASEEHIKKGEVQGGRIETIIGPMFSGKTTELFRRMRRYRVAQKKVITVKFHQDTIYHAEKAATHDLVTEDAISCSQLADCLPLLMKKEVVCIDEGHFFPDLTEVSDYLANQGKIVLVAALDADYRREPFHEVSRLVAKSEAVEKLDSVCMKCCQKASFSKRISSEQELHVVGGREKYICLCRSCYRLIEEAE